MRTKEWDFENKTNVNIYVTKEEKTNPEIIEKIEKFKKIYDRVFTYISGDTDINYVLKEMIKYELKRI